MEKLRMLVTSAKGKSWKYRLKLIHQELVDVGSNWIVIPAEGYVELESYGPFPVKEIEWIEIDPIERRKGGKLMPEKIFDHFHEVTSLLSDLKINFTAQNNIIRLKIVDQLSTKLSVDRSD